MTPESVPPTEPRSVPDTAAVEYVQFSARYGVHTRNESDRPGWWSRHASSGEPESGPFRCACPGTSSNRRCADHASQEDRLCDACREFCWAIDDARLWHRLIDVYGAAS